MVASSKRVYATPRSSAPRVLAPGVAPADPTSTGDAQTQSVSVAVGSLGPGAHKVCLSPPSISAGYAV